MGNNWNLQSRNMNNKYFLDHLFKTIDLYNRKYDNVVIMDDFNLDPPTELFESLCSNYDLFNLVKEPTCFKGPPKCYDLILTNCKHSFQNTEVFTTGFSDFHKMVFTVLKTEFVKAYPIKINYRDYSNFNSIHFRDELRKELSENPPTNNDYELFQNTLCEVLNKHALVKGKYLRANDSPFMTKHLRKLIMNRSGSKHTYLKKNCIGEIIAYFVTSIQKKLLR